MEQIPPERSPASRSEGGSIIQPIKAGKDDCTLSIKMKNSEPPPVTQEDRLQSPSSVEEDGKFTAKDSFCFIKSPVVSLGPSTLVTSPPLVLLPPPRRSIRLAIAESITLAQQEEEEEKEETSQRNEADVKEENVQDDDDSTDTTLSSISSMDDLLSPETIQQDTDVSQKFDTSQSSSISYTPFYPSLTGKPISVERTEEYRNRYFPGISMKGEGEDHKEISVYSKVPELAMRLFASPQSDLHIHNDSGESSNNIPLRSITMPILAVPLDVPVKVPDPLKDQFRPEDKKYSPNRISSGFMKTMRFFHKISSGSSTLQSERNFSTISPSSSSKKLSRDARDASLLPFDSLREHLQDNTTAASKRVVNWCSEAEHATIPSLESLHKFVPCTHDDGRHGLASSAKSVPLDGSAGDTFHHRVHSDTVHRSSGGISWQVGSADISGFKAIQYASLKR